MNKVVDIYHLRVILLYSLFLLPLCHALAGNSCAGQITGGDNALQGQDTLYIETETAAYETIYRLCQDEQGKRKVVFEVKTADGSSIDFVQRCKSGEARLFDCFALYNGGADGNRFLFFDYESQKAYITPTCFSGFYPMCSSVDFSGMEVLLENENSDVTCPNDTLYIDSTVSYLPFNRSHRIIKAKFVPLLLSEQETKQHVCTLPEDGQMQKLAAYVAQEDLSDLFVDLTLTGILGEECSRMDIRLEAACRTDVGTYAVKGASRICLSVVRPLEGVLRIDSISSGLGLKGECTDVDGFVYGSYAFREYDADGPKATCCGRFRQAYRIDGQRVGKGRNDIPELRMNLSEYTGHRQVSGGKAEVCAWADSFVPGAPEDFCSVNDAGEWVVMPKYRKNGWDNLYDAYFNDSLTDSEVQKARLAEEGRWWLAALNAPSDGGGHCIRAYCDTLIGNADGDGIPDTVNVRVVSHCCYENEDGRRECFSQTDCATLKIRFGGAAGGLTLRDEETFDYPYSGLSSLSYSLDTDNGIVRHCRSSRHSDKVYVDAYYRYCPEQKNFFRLKRRVRKYEGATVTDSVMQPDSERMPLGIIIKENSDECKRPFD